jgi:2'-5' RNA ligase
MKYVLVYLIRGKVERYHQKLVKEVGPKFGERYMIENPLPSHITLKSPFELKDYKELDNILKTFVKKHKSTKIKINGFGNFNRFVTFLKINTPKKVVKIQKELLKEVKKIKGIDLHKFDLRWKPHATISYGNTAESFNKIWKYLKTLEKPNFKLDFDNITILRKSKKLWKVYKIYSLN